MLDRLLNSDSSESQVPGHNLKRQAIVLDRAVWMMVGLRQLRALCVHTDGAEVCRHWALGCSACNAPEVG